MKNILFIVPFFFSFLIINAQEVECPDGYIADCNGNCAPETWGADDGYCDDGSASFNLELTLENGGSPVWCEDCEEEGYVAIYFNCEEYNWDGSDCDTEEEEICEGITVTCDGGDWQSEVEWGIYTCDGELMLSGGAPYSECIDGLPDVFNIAMFDSWGDGWNGNTLVIGDASYTMDSGSALDINVGCDTEEEEEEEIVEEEICEGTTIFSDGSGGWPYEITWTISNCEGEIIAEGTSPDDQCIELPDVYTIEMYDSYGDGWNGNTLNIEKGR